MNHQRNTNPKSIRRGGFSFAEMMVAVAILGLLTTVTGMALLNMVNRSRIKQTKVIMDDVMSALIAYRDELGRWPRDANIDCPLNGPQPNYVLNGFDNGREFLASLVGKDTDELARQGTFPKDWFNKSFWLDEDDVWPGNISPFGEFGEHLLVMMKVSPSRAVLTKLEEAGNVSRREAAEELEDPLNCQDKGKYSVFYVTDAWNREVLYRRFESENGGMPQLLSAGPDKAFGTDDDVRSTDRD